MLNLFNVNYLLLFKKLLEYAFCGDLIPIIFYSILLGNYIEILLVQMSKNQEKFIQIFLNDQPLNL